MLWVPWVLGSLGLLVPWVSLFHLFVWFSWLTWFPWFIWFFWFLWFHVVHLSNGSFVMYFLNVLQSIRTECFAHFRVYAKKLEVFVWSERNHLRCVCNALFACRDVTFSLKMIRKAYFLVNSYGLIINNTEPWGCQSASPSNEIYGLRLGVCTRNKNEIAVFKWARTNMIGAMRVSSILASLNTSWARTWFLHCFKSPLLVRVDSTQEACFQNRTCILWIRMLTEPTPGFGFLACQRSRIAGVQKHKTCDPSQHAAKFLLLQDLARQCIFLTRSLPNEKLTFSRNDIKSNTGVYTFYIRLWIGTHQCRACRSASERLYILNTFHPCVFSDIAARQTHARCFFLKFNTSHHRHRASRIRCVDEYEIQLTALRADDIFFFV